MTVPGLTMAKVLDYVKSRNGTGDETEGDGVKRMALEDIQNTSNGKVAFKMMVTELNLSQKNAVGGISRGRWFGIPVLDQIGIVEE